MIAMKGTDVGMEAARSTSQTTKMGKCSSNSSTTGTQRTPYSTVHHITSNSDGMKHSLMTSF